MNLRVVTYLSYEGDGTEIEELVADFAKIVNERGFGNDLTDESNSLKSLIAVKENFELNEVPANEFFASELENSLLRVVPTEEDKIDKELLEESHA